MRRFAIFAALSLVAVSGCGTSASGPPPWRTSWRMPEELGDDPMEWVSNREVYRVGRVIEVVPAQEILDSGSPFSLVLVRCITEDLQSLAPRTRAQMTLQTPPGGGSPVFADDNGVMRLKAWRPGTYVLRTAFSGPRDDELRPLYGVTRFTVPELGSVYVIDHRLTPGITITGRVLREDTKEPIAALKVVAQGSFDHSPKLFNTETDADGRFSFDMIIPDSKWAFAAHGRKDSHEGVVQEVFVTRSPPAIILYCPPRKEAPPRAPIERAP